jgi:hypothetical protein
MDLFRRARSRLAASRPARCGTAILAVAVVIEALNQLWIASVNPWILVTAPLNAAHAGNSIIGYSWLLDGGPIHKENLSPLLQSLSFNGILAYPDGYFLRPIYPFLVSLNSWFLGLRTAAFTINALAYGVLVVAAGWLAYQLCRSRSAAAWAATLTAVGSGSLVHLNDLSAHMLAFASYAMVTCLLFASRVWCARQPLSVHVAIGIALALAGLVYPNGFLLTVGYVLTAAPHSRLVHVTGACALGFLVRYAWEHFLSFAYWTFFGVELPDLYTLDFGAAQRISVDYWLDLVRNHPANLVGAVLRPLTDSLFVAFPALSIAGIVATIIVNRASLARLWFFLVFLSLPYVSIVFFSPGAVARGYLAYSSAFILFASLIALVFRHARGRRMAKTVGTVAAAGCVIVQMAWSLAVYFGYFFPAVAFYCGPSIGGASLTQTDVVNLAGTAPLWRFFGGPAGFSEAGGLPFGKIVTAEGIAGSFGFSFALNAFILSLVVAAIAAWSWQTSRMAPGLSGTEGAARTLRWSPLKRSCTWPLVWLACALLVSGAGSQLQKQSVQPFAADQLTPLRGEQTLVMRLRISAEVSRKILEHLRSNPDLEGHVFLRGSGLVEPFLSIGGEQLGIAPIPGYSNALLWRLDTAALQRALVAGNDWLVLSASLRDGAVGGWQRASPPSREVSPKLVANGQEYWPSLELRLVNRARNTTVFLGY